MLNKHMPLACITAVLSWPSTTRGLPKGGMQECQLVTGAILTCRVMVTSFPSLAISFSVVGLGVQEKGGATQ
jgi:hypothetical protein